MHRRTTTTGAVTIAAAATTIGYTQCDSTTPASKLPTGARPSLIVRTDGSHRYGVEYVRDPDGYRDEAGVYHARWRFDDVRAWMLAHSEYRPAEWSALWASARSAQEQGVTVEYLDRFDWNAVWSITDGYCRVATEYDGVAVPALVVESVDPCTHTVIETYVLPREVE